MLKMSSLAAARSIFRSTSSARNATVARFASKAKARTSPSSAPFRNSGNSSSNRLLSESILRRPVELSFGVESMMPYHSVTASALMISMLSISGGSYGWLLEGL